jgi:hypothetical protein
MKEKASWVNWVIICSILATFVALGINGFSPSTVQASVAENEESIIEITGVPQSASFENYADNVSATLFVIQEGGKKSPTRCKYKPRSKVESRHWVAVLLEAEANDKDDEIVTIKGYYKDDVFIAESVSGNGFCIDD